MQRVSSGVREIEKEDVVESSASIMSDVLSTGIWSRPGRCGLERMWTSDRLLKIGGRSEPNFGVSQEGAEKSGAQCQRSLWYAAS